ncbi:uncharacterized protein LOC110025200 [Phalaenopsis equestris]|uniref:uncharacterized protein LOC110025200 n=1 Tax=Phalaenopsis equestris TaxID=78828 RepID=UPI0009E1DF08|nr:uncharacterized protein LOC110025200 [Phalaenopsis equestris]
MGVLKFLVISVLFAMMIAGIRSEDEATVNHVDDAVGAEESDSVLKIEIEQLRSKITSLESSTLEKAKELKNKDEKIEQLEREIEEKSSIVASLQSEVELLQKKGAVDAEELVGKARAHSNELEKKIEKLKNELLEQVNKKDALERRTMEAEEKVQELHVKLENLEKINVEQKLKIQKTERAIKVVEEELMKAQLEQISKSKDLKEVHGAWLPPWLSNHIVRCQEIVAVHWSEHGESTFNVLVQKISKKSDQAQKWVKPHLETAKTKWIPIVKTKLVAFSNNVKPHIEKLSTKTVEVIEVCRSTATPHVVKLQELSDPYIQDLRKFSKPYIEQVATFTKPHVEKARTILKPYTRRVLYGYGKFLETAGTYHHQIQETVQQNLQKHELTKHLATKELIWFVASGSLALPIFLLYRMVSSTFGKKATKSVRGGRSHNHRRHKRRHADQ